LQMEKIENLCSKKFWNQKNQVSSVRQVICANRPVCSLCYNICNFSPRPTNH
jgi:hypothetical protein